jgi:hypothetical protein
MTEDFWPAYETILDTVLKGCTRYSPEFSTLMEGNSDPKTVLGFVKGVHRSFDLAQSGIIAGIGQLRASETLPEGARFLREMYLRKIADAIAFAMLEYKTYVAKRLCLFPRPHHIELAVLNEAAKEAKRMNGESRLGFSLLADLTTFVQVADILRIDLRDSESRVALIELKSGKVNKMLLEELEKYEPEPASIELLRDNPSIDKRHKKQAERMLRQRIRLAQITEILDSNHGTDPGLELPAFLTHDEFEEEDYDDFLEDLCDRAREEGGAAAVIQQCLHLGIGYSEDPGEAARAANHALGSTVTGWLESPPEGASDVVAELDGCVPEQHRFLVLNPVLQNACTAPNRPLTLWRISRANLRGMLEGKLCIGGALNLPGYIWLARRMGLDVRMSSAKEATKIAQRVGGSNLVQWNGRLVRTQAGSGMPLFMAGGMLTRYFCNLCPPAQFFANQHALEDEPKVA